MQQNRVVCPVEYVPEFLLALPQRLFHLLLLADVPDYTPVGSNLTRFILHRGQGAVRNHRFAALFPDNHLIFSGTLCINHCKYPLPVRRKCIYIAFQIKVLHLLPGVIAEHRDAFLVHVEDFSSGGCDKKAIE